MTRTLLVALTCAAVASASRYADYSGVKMPQYGADYDTQDASGALSATDYQGRSPDAPAALDYKYEEESNGKTPTSLKRIDPWQKPARKQRGSVRQDGNDNLDNLYKYSSNDNVDSKLKSNHRNSKHRSRLKINRQSRGEPHSRIRYAGDKVDIRDRNGYLLDTDEFPDDKSKDFNEDESHYGRRVTERIKRRKVRDRFVKSRIDSEILDDDADLLSIKSIKDDLNPDLEYPTNGDDSRRRPIEHQDIRERMPSTNDDDEEIISRPRMEIKPKAKEEYNDYYDMNRLQSLKTKLPELLRRTTTTIGATMSTSTRPLPLWNFRRTPENAGVALQNITRTKPEETTPKTTYTTTDTPSSPTKVQIIQTSTELSLAEKSRLSILKKSRKKDNSKSLFSTNKPPVLLQVTKYLPTVVIVEPPTSQDPWMRARLVSDDSPSMLDKVKRLMRHKLVAGARNIQDLTSNWDDMVCDYIDTSLLAGSATTLAINSLLITIITNSHILLWYLNR